MIKIAENRMLQVILAPVVSEKSTMIAVSYTHLTLPTKRIV